MKMKKWKIIIKKRVNRKIRLNTQMIVIHLEILDSAMKMILKKAKIMSTTAEVELKSLAFIMRKMTINKLSQSKKVILDLRFNQTRILTLSKIMN
jgi:hypothetical protein